MTASPGPWQVTTTTDRFQVTYHEIADANGQVIGEACVAPKRGVTHEIAEDNARLMAASPEMLEALEWAFARVGRPTQRIQGQNHEHYDRYFAVEALIANTKGGNDA